MADTFGRGPQADSGFFRIAAMHEALQQLRLIEETRAAKASAQADAGTARKTALRPADKA